MFGHLKFAEIRPGCELPMPKNSQSTRTQLWILGTVFVSGFLSLGSLLLVDYTSLNRHKSLVQQVAISSALKSASVLPLVNATAEEIDTVRRGRLACSSGLSVYQTRKVDSQDAHFVTSNIDGLTGLQVSVEWTWSSVFGILSLLDARPVIAGAEVRLLGSGKFHQKIVPASSVATMADRLGPLNNKLSRCRT